MLEKLTWDSDFFKLPVFKCNLTASSDLEDLRSEVADIKTHSPNAVVYINCLSDNMTSVLNDSLLKMGAQSYGSRVIYNHPLTQKTCVLNPTCCILEKPTQEAIAVAIGSSRYSRFRLDPRLEPYADKLYERWILNGFKAVEKGTGTVFAVKINGEIAGILSLSWKNFDAKIELIAVQEKFGRRGLGKILINNAIALVQQKGCKTFSVVTQGENDSAMKFYTSCGFILFQKEYIWHLHLH